MPKITALKGRAVFNSRGSKTIEIDVFTDNRYLGRACAPSGASVGKYEAQSFPNNDPQKALETFNANSQKFIGLEASEPSNIFDCLKSIDNSETYIKLGGSVAYAVSIGAIESAVRALNVHMFQLIEKSKAISIPISAW